MAVAPYKGGPGAKPNGTFLLTAAERRLTGREAELYVEELTRQLTASYQSVIKDLQRELLGGTLSGARQARIQSLLASAETAVAKLNRAADTFAQKAVPIIYRRGVDTAAEHLLALGVDVTVGAKADFDLDTLMGATLHREAIAVMADSLVQDLVGANLGIGGTASRFIRRAQLTRAKDVQMDKLVLEGLIQGDRRRDVSDRIYKALQDQIVNGEFVVINGRKYHADWYAELVARTRTREAVNQGRVNTALENGVTLIEIDTHESACPKCREFVGRVYSVDGTDPDFPKAVIIPPFHPHCKCNSYPVPKEHLRSKPYYDALVQFSNDPQADFAAYERNRVGGVGYVAPAPKPKPKRKARTKTPTAPAVPAPTPTTGGNTLINATPGQGRTWAPAPTLEEARDYTQALVSDGARGRYPMAPNGPMVRFGQDVRQSMYGQAAVPPTLRLDALNTLNRVMTELEEEAKRIGIPALRAVQAETSSVAAMGDGVLFINPDLFNDRFIGRESRGKNWISAKTAKLERLKDEVAKAEEALAKNEFIDFGILSAADQREALEASVFWGKKDIKILEDELAKGPPFKPDTGYALSVWTRPQGPGGRSWSVTDYLDGVEDRVLKTTYHEFAHHIHQQLGVTGANDYLYPPLEKELDRLFQQAYPGAKFQGGKQWLVDLSKADPDNYAPSIYGDTNPREWFAESYGAYKMGRKDLVPKILIPLIEKIEKGQWP